MKSLEGLMKKSIAEKPFCLRGMAFRIFVPICFSLNVFSAASQTRLTPPKKGRTVVLESVRKIVDDGTDLILKAPRDPWVDEDGALYFAEGPSVYKFRDGRQVFRVGKKGQGPGECQFVYSFAFLDGILHVQSNNPPKILDFSANGAFQKDRNIDPRRVFWKLFSAKGELYGLIDEMHSHPERIGIDGYVDSEFSLNRISPDFKKIIRVADIAMLHFVKNGSWRRVGQLDIAVHDPYVFVLHSDKYKIDRMDLRSGRIDKTISRKFDSKKNEFDIIRICFQGDRLWAVTSERSKNGMDRLVDVYDVDGALIDAFYLHLPEQDEDYRIGNFVLSRDGVLSIVQENKTEGFLSIGQYRIR
jgi:hypothetical protein